LFINGFLATDDSNIDYRAAVHIPSSLSSETKENTQKKNSCTFCSSNITSLTLVQHATFFFRCLLSVGLRVVSFTSIRILVEIPQIIYPI
jgi:hypothetical protein